MFPVEMRGPVGGKAVLIRRWLACDRVERPRRKRAFPDGEDLLHGGGLQRGRGGGALPKDLPPKSMVWNHCSRWEWEGCIERIRHALFVAVREQAGREASPPPAIFGSQMAKAAQDGALRSTCPLTARARRSPGASAIG